MAVDTLLGWLALSGGWGSDRVSLGYYGGSDFVLASMASGVLDIQLVKSGVGVSIVRQIESGTASVAPGFHMDLRAIARVMLLHARRCEGNIGAGVNDRNPNPGGKLEQRYRQRDHPEAALTVRSGTNHGIQYSTSVRILFPDGADGG
ncbi:MAG: hypothetical protein ACE5HT_11180 [Gemmatimonadales bacterium]